MLFIKVHTETCVEGYYLQTQMKFIAFPLYASLPLFPASFHCISFPNYTHWVAYFRHISHRYKVPRTVRNELPNHDHLIGISGGGKFITKYLIGWEG